MQRYKLFYNNCRLLIASYEHNYQTGAPPENCFLFTNSFKKTSRHAELVSAFPAIDNRACPIVKTRNDEDIIINSSNLPEFFSKFLSSKQNSDLLYTNEIGEKQIKKALLDFFIFKRAAGGIVFKGNAILSIFRFNRWDFPKGHVEVGETDADAALREVAEETGITELTIEKDLNSTYHIFKNENEQFVLKETHWYQMRTHSEKPPVPQTEESISDAKWIPFSELDSIVGNTYPSIRELMCIITKSKSSSF